MRFLGYKIVTLSEALDAAYGRFACLTVDSTDAVLLTKLPEQLAPLAAPATVFAASGQVGGPGQARWSRLKALQGLGWDIGTLGHDLARLSEQSSNDQRQSVARARSLYLAHLGHEPTLFAYPFGAYDATTVSCVKDEGFRAAVSLRSGLNNGETVTEPFHLKRLPLAGDLMRDVILVLRNAVRRLPHAAPGGVLPHGERERLRSGAAL